MNTIGKEDPLTTPFRPAAAARVPASERIMLWLARHWLLLFGFLWGVYVILPWLAPLLMKVGATGAGALIYSIYSTQCHQLPERSYFLFGPKFMYSLPEIQAAWVRTNDPLILRQFTGSSAMGWKVAWSDRMVSLYGGVWAGVLLFGLLRRRLAPLRLWTLVVAALPMAIDGGTHFVSDLAGGGVGLGFRDTNVWLATLSAHSLPAWFYAGDALGSFNWWMRLLTGLIFGLALVLLAFPYMEDSALGMLHDLRRREG